jgi:hypothetical protein
MQLNGAALTKVTAVMKEPTRRALRGPRRGFRVHYEQPSE